MTILTNRHNSDILEKYIIPKSTNLDNEEYVEITIDHSENVFTAKRIKGEFKLSSDWKVYEDFTFPSSLLNKFLNNH